MGRNMNNGHIYLIQVLFVTGIAAGSQVLNLEDKLKWLNVARYTIYILTISAIPHACRLLHRLLQGAPAQAALEAAAAARGFALIYSACVALLVLTEQKIFDQNFVFVFLAYLVVQYPEMAEGVEKSDEAAGSSHPSGKKSVNYGVGMACSYFEGYLVHILPSDGHKFVGFEENIRCLEKGDKAARSRLEATPPAFELRPPSLKPVEHEAQATATISTDKVKDKTLKYGVILACHYFEDRLMHLLPSDAHEMVGFAESVRNLEDSEGVLFPVKKMFIVITKSFYSPPDLKEFNRGTDVPHLEAFNELPTIRKSVAGVKDRTYHNTAYKIYRPRAPPVCLTVECASPLHTLHKVICNRALYNELAEVDIEEVKNDFCNTLQSILNKSHECRGKCELIYYDHEDPKQNLSEILLNRIRELCPNFEEQILARRAENKIVHDDA